MDCMNWQEEMFWTHFQSIHFVQFLHYGFGQHLAIPEKFATKFKTKLPKSVTLKGPSGISWNVGLKTKDDALFFDYGWTEFVNDHQLEVNDILVFKYNGVAHFDVLMLDGQSLCEKATSYFVRKSVNDERESGSREKRKEMESCVEAIPTSPCCDIEGTLQKSKNTDLDLMPLGQPVVTPEANKKMCKGTPQKSMNNDLDEIPLRQSKVSHDGNKNVQGDVEGTRKKSVTKDLDEKTLRQTKVSLDADKKMRGGLFSSRSVHTPQTLKSMELLEESDDDVEVVKSDDADPEHMTSSTKVVNRRPNHVSHRKAVTDKEKMNAFHLAQKATSNQGFLVIMKPTHVSKKFFMSIPSGWVNRHLSHEKQQVILRMNEKTWKITFSYSKARHSGGLACGWRDFALDNHLEEFDVCVFEPTKPARLPITLDVRVFRVVQAPIPLSQRSPEPQSP